MKAGVVRERGKGKEATIERERKAYFGVNTDIAHVVETNKVAPFAI